MRAGRDFTVLVAVQNRGSVPLESSGPAPLHLAYRWRGEDERDEPLRTTFPHVVRPRALQLVDVRVRAPHAPGRRELTLTLVHETVRWYDRGDDAIAETCAVDVRVPGVPPPLDVQRYERRHRSQNGEDGIIAELLLRVGWRSRYLVEFGASDGFENNSATLIEEYGWGGLLIESDARSFARLAERFADRPGLQLREEAVRRETIAAIFREHAVPTEFDLLSIDVDGNDYWLWDALSRYRPRIVAIEYNAAYPPPRRWVMAYDPEHRWRGDTHHGASLASLDALGTRLGYALVGTDSRGVNAFFVRADLTGGAGLTARAPADVYTPPAFRHPFAEGPFVEI